jgi:Cytochrome bd terminal oxidase subunit I
MQVPVGYVAEHGDYAPSDWMRIIFNCVVWSRFPHMLLAAYLTGAFCVAATGAWYVLGGRYRAEARVMLRMGLFLAAGAGLSEIACCSARSSSAFPCLSLPSSRLRPKAFRFGSSDPGPRLMPLTRNEMGRLVDEAGLAVRA